MNKPLVASFDSIRRQFCPPKSKSKDDWVPPWKALLLIILTLLVGSCTSIKAPISPIDPEPETRTSSLEQSSFERDALLKSIIEQAESAFDAKALTTPSQTSALHYYRELLVLQPNHPAAIDGLRRIVDQYIAWALTAIDEGNYAKAHQFLERAARVNPKSPSIAAASEQIRRKREQATSIEIVPDWLLAEGDSEPTQDEVETKDIVSAYFTKIANKIDTLSAKVTIYSRTDRQGRWLYQKINAHTGQRLRATLKIDTPSRIELHFKPQLDTIAPPSEQLNQ